MLKIPQHNKYTQPLLEPGAMLAQRLKKFEARRKVDAGETAAAGRLVDSQGLLFLSVLLPLPIPACLSKQTPPSLPATVYYLFCCLHGKQLALDRPS